MLSNILYYADMLLPFAAFATVGLFLLDCAVAALRASSRFSGVIIRLGCVLAGRSGTGFVRLALILTRLMLMLCFSVFKCGSVYVSGTAIILQSLCIYLLLPQFAFAATDLLLTVLLFNLLIVKDFLLDYSLRVSAGTGVLAVTVLLCALCALISCCIFCYAVERDMSVASKGKPVDEGVSVKKEKA